MAGNSTKQTDSYQGCLTNTSDIKELIPEFYYLSDFLCPQENNESERCETAAWSEGKADKFVQIMRAALESEYMSSHLHLWILSQIDEFGQTSLQLFINTFYFFRHVSGEFT